MTAGRLTAAGATLPLSHIAGVLLAGGKSSRFGSEKSVAPFRGRLLMDAVIAAFDGLSRVAVSAKSHSEAAKHAHDLGLTVIADDACAPSGPLAGVTAGLDWAHREGFAAIATLPCDAPLVPAGFVSALAREIGAAPAAYAATPQGQHPLCAIWRVELRTPLAARLTAGDHPSVRGFLKESNAAAVHFENAHAFANANTAEALAALERGA
ncbi:MAG: molybdenum cofactor guanylyltransferase [Hyphomonadaceae bacterium]|nr:molybdenum cofactor guanylyltransferase [Hyphomonadaceae bacterium]